VAAPNGKPRKQLSDQLDRLDVQKGRADAILYAHSEGLNGAVTDATKEGTRAAVKDAVIELLTDPELRAALHKASAPPARPRVSARDRLRANARQLAARTAAMTRAARQAVAAKVAEAKAIVAGAAAPAWVAWQLRKTAVVGLGIGVVVAGIAYLGGHGLVAGLAGLGAAVTTVAVQTALWVRKAVRRLVPA
jgi:hypothetical protein